MKREELRETNDLDNPTTSSDSGCSGYSGCSELEKILIFSIRAVQLYISDSSFISNVFLTNDMCGRAEGEFVCWEHFHGECVVCTL